MARDIDITIKARNEANAELQRLSRELAGVSRALRDMSGPANQAASGNQKVARSFDDAGRSADAATGKVSRFGAEIARGAAIGAGFAGLNAVMRGVGAGLDFVADSAIGMNSRLEQSQVAFTTMLGSAERADSFLRDLGDFAKTTPFEFPELVQTSQRLLAMGFAAGEVIPLMTDIGNVASSLGRGTEGIDRIVMALGQMESKTRVQTEELLQLQEIGVPALQILADAMGVTVAESQKMVSAGQVASDVFIGAFQEWSQVNFGDMMEQQSRTMTGAISNITDTLQMAAANGLRPFFDLARDGAVELADFLGSPEFESFASDLSEDLSGAADAVRSFVSDNREGLKETAEAFGTIAQNAESAGQMIGTVAGALNELKVPAAVKLLLEDLATLNERLANTIEITLDFDARVDYGETTPDSGVVDKLWRGLVSGDMIGSLVGVGREHGEAYYSGIEDGVSNASGASGGSFGSDLVKEMFQFDAAEMGPFLDEIIVGPLLSMEPQVREELKGIFTLDPDIGASFAASITGMVAEGSVSFEEGMNILSAIPRETLEPALQEIESDLHGKLAEALISGEDTAQVREQLSLVQGMLGETAEFVASSAIGFTEFGTAGEMAMANVATAADGLQGALDGLSGAYQIGLEVQQQFTGQASEYASGQKNIEDALEAVQKKQEEGIELSEEELKLLDLGEDAIGRYVGGQEDATIQAGLAATANAELMRAQDDLNRAIADGETDLQPYLDRVKDAEQFARDMGLATDDNTSAQDDFFNAVTDVITKLGELIDKLDGVPEKITTEIELNTASAIANYDGFLQYLRDNPGQSDLYVNQITNMGYTENNERGGPINKDTLSWVGEAGPELVLLPKGAHVYPHEESMGMANRMGIPGYATGTPDRPQLSRMEETALTILGDLEVLLNPESVARAEAELAALWDAKRVAEELGLGDAVIAEINEQIRAKEAELRIIGAAAGTSVGQGITDQIAAEIEAADLEAAREALTDSLAGLLSDMDGIISGETGTRLGEQLVEALSLQKIAEEMGDADLAAHYAEQVAAINEQLEQLGDIMETPFVQAEIAAAQAAEAIVPITEEAFAALAETLAGAPELVGQFADDILQGLHDGTFDIEQATELLGHGAADALIPGLERIEEQLTIDLVEAILAGNAELEADILEKLRLLELLQDELDDTTQAADTFRDSATGIYYPSGPANGTGSGGGSRGGGGGTGSRSGGASAPGGGLGGSRGGGGSSSGLGTGGSSNPVMPGQMTGPISHKPNPLWGDTPGLSGGFAGGFTPDGTYTRNPDGVQTYQDAVRYYQQTGDATLMGKYAIAEFAGAAGSHGGDIAGYMEDLVRRLEDPAVHAENGNKLIRGIAGLIQQYPELLYDQNFWDGLAGPMGYAGFAVQGRIEMNNGGDISRLIPAIKGMVAAYLTGRYYYSDAHNGLMMPGHNPAGKSLIDRIQNPTYRSVEDALAGNVSGPPGLGEGPRRTGNGTTSGGLGSRGSSVRAFADGGIITSPLFGLVGEAGPEMVQPLKQEHPERERLIADIAEAVIRSTDGGRSATFVVDGKVFIETVGKRAMHSVNGRVR